MGKDIRIEIYDCTLRDGAQGEGIDFSVDNKAHIAGRLDKMGREDGPGLLVHYVEGGYPGSNPKDMEFFERLKKRPLRNAELTAFGSTRYKDKTPEEDRRLKALLDAETDIATIFGKSWDFHVDKVLETDLETNLEMIRDSVSYLRAQGKRVFFDAEHFFSGCLGNPAKGLKGNKVYALETLVAAAEAGAERLILCETNGGIEIFNHPGLLEGVVDHLRGEGINVPLGIHAHNDGGFAVANTLNFVYRMAELGEPLVQIQGTINGFGERTGNADLVQILANLHHNGFKVASDAAMRHLTEISRYVYELAGMEPDPRQPFVGTHLGHKGGLHINAQRKNPGAYEHFDLAAYGNTSHLVVSDQSGRSTILEKANEFGLEFDEDFAKEFLGHVKQLEHRGYSFEAADASLYLEMLRQLSKYQMRLQQKGEKYGPLMHIKELNVETRKTSDRADPLSRAILEAKVKGEDVYAIVRREGPVEAMDVTMREVLEGPYPYLKEIRLVDFKVHMVEPKKGTTAVVRVLITSKDGEGREWTTVGAHRNIIEASRIALMDAYEFGIRKYAPEQLKP